MSRKNNSSNIGSNFAKNISQQRSHSRIKPGAIAFWVIFASIMGLLFMANRERISATIQNAPFPSWFSRNKASGTDTPPAAALQETTGAAPLETLFEDDVDDGDNGIAMLDADAALASDTAGTLIPTDGGVEKVSGTILDGTDGVTPGGVAQNRSLYFIQVDREGSIMRTRITRQIASAGSPLQETLRALIQGPTSEENSRGLRSLIPEGTKLLSVTIRGETAFINLSEDFRFNHYGLEGYAAQVHQLVWTATEFPTVKDAQLLIEGQRVDWLVEGLWIGSPLKRASL
ncbi:MAG: GerMN domain-containing protein [Treponema sp.]|nr:GerMN domain-containing protein [Treponema sp.]